MRGEIKHVGIRSRVLGLVKRYYVYLPPGYRATRLRFPVLYLFRGHEREWVNPYEDSSRAGKTIADILDPLIHQQKIRPMIAVMPGLCSDDNVIPGLGINMLAAHRAAGHQGIGSGRFEDYLLQELVPHIDAKYRTIPERTSRGVDGFSLGGYTAMFLAVRHPELFASAGCYDATHMWKRLIDPRPGTRGIDRTWMQQSFLDPAFNLPRDIRFMHMMNPTDIIAEARGRVLALLRNIAFHVQSAAYDGQKGNMDRARHFVGVLKKAGIGNSFPDVVLSGRAVHSWRYADMHMRMVLPLHDSVFHRG